MNDELRELGKEAVLVYLLNSARARSEGLKNVLTMDISQHCNIVDAFLAVV
jgi:hypothetical protein